MIKKVFTAVILSFMIICVEGQSNIAEAKFIYVGEFRYPYPYDKKCYKAYLDDTTVRGNANFIACCVNLEDTCLVKFSFIKGLKHWAVQIAVVGAQSGMTYVHNPLDEFDQKLLNYILDNFE